MSDLFRDLFRAIIMTMKITKWYRKLEGDNYEFNHIENGWSTVIHPEPKYPEQNQWKSSKWKKKYAHLIDNRVVNIPYFELNINQLRAIIDDVWMFINESTEVPHHATSDRLLEPYIGKVKWDAYFDLEREKK